MIQSLLVEPGRLVTILFTGPSSKPLQVIINDGRLTFSKNAPVYISQKSPLAKAILNHKTGDCIKFQAPEGKLEVKIVSVTN